MVDGSGEALHGIANQGEAPVVLRPHVETMVGAKPGIFAVTVDQRLELLIGNRPQRTSGIDPHRLCAQDRGRAQVLQGSPIVALSRIGFRLPYMNTVRMI